MTGFEGKVAIVSGGCGGIGQAIMRALNAAGARAFALDLQPAPDGLVGLRCNVADDSEVSHQVRKVHEQYGRLDFLVHAAGISCDAVLWKLTVEDWDRILAVNLRGAFSLLRHAVPWMRPEGGRAVLVGSINGSRGKFGTSAYSASKAGLLGLAKTVARETGRFGITVNVIEPGWVRTPLTDAVPQEIRDAAAAQSLIGELLDPSDIANAVLYLCGPGGARITGQILRVDAGQYLGAS
jgi:NAD(P)-dependent dehydrogenase (short-subunit alcohol dehydrogenase family)